MRKVLLSFGPFLGALLLASAANAQTPPPACATTPPAEVTAPATPSINGGMNAARNKNFGLARANFLPLANNGDVEAERNLGSLLMQDCTGMQDKAAATSWLQKAADGGDVPAAAELGGAYMNGNGVAQDDSKAFPLVSKAANGGVMGAQVNLGLMYMTGRGVDADKYQAITWWVKAGEQGAPVGLLNIANSYIKGNGLPQDNKKAALYLFTGMGRTAPAQMSRFTSLINGIADKMSPADLKIEADKARKWSPGKGSLDDVLDDAKEAHKAG